MNFLKTETGDTAYYLYFEETKNVVWQNPF